ncbi:hypothetical protein Q5698_08180 [Brucella intermedia]|uniref:hypothetical protein n=1 Tax=Brucella intermedia TaxID=94625 RepID=UPI002735CD3A|nr:hypothetical protein [Brucella intermedia]WLF95647.1 hypothetical protein Q5698_08180 [Brucella intermedia]
MTASHTDLLKQAAASTRDIGSANPVETSLWEIEFLKRGVPQTSAGSGRNFAIATKLSEGKMVGPEVLRISGLFNSLRKSGTEMHVL